MLAPLGRPLAGLALVLLWGWLALAAAPSPPSSNPSPAKHTLRYKFRPGETLKWQVEHRVTVETTVSGNTQTAEAITGSVKVWRIKEVAADGSATLENFVEDVDMRQKLTGRAEVHYNSKTDKRAPLGFESFARSIGVPLSRITVDAKGTILKRQHLVGDNPDGQGQVMVVLPDSPVAVGETWSLAYDLDVPLVNKLVKKIKTYQSYTLLDVADGVATIRLATQILTPINDPAVEIQIIQRETTGTVRFDIAAGRVVAQRADVDKKVFGFSGAASTCHYRTQFTEKLLDANHPIAETKPPQPADKAVEPDNKTRGEEKNEEKKTAGSEPKALQGVKKTAGSEPKVLQGVKKTAEADAPRPLPGSAKPAQPAEAIVPEPRRVGGSIRR